MAFNRFRLLAFILLLPLLLTACSARPTSTPAPTLTPTIAATEVPKIPIYQLNTKQSVINYLATGALNITFPGTFSLKGNTVRLVPEGNGYRVKIDMVIDGDSVTAVNDLVKNALKGNLETDKYPNGYFIADSKEIVNLSAAPVTCTLSGTLELHGRKKIFEMPITLSLQGDKLTGSGQTSLDLLDYEVSVPTAIMNSKITFKASIVASEAGSGSATAAVTAAATP
jgi:hypothetical protein